MQHAKYDRTLVIIKPDGVQRSLIGEVIRRLERVGLKLVASKFMVPNVDQIEKHYTLDAGWFMSTGSNTIKSYKSKGLPPPFEDPIEVGKWTLEKLKKYMVSGPSLFMVWQGANAAPLVRKLTGVAEPLGSDVGTIRGDFMLDSYAMADGDVRAVRNILHASGSPKEAEDEINFWFKPEEVIKYTIVQEKILYDANLDGLLE